MSIISVQSVLDKSVSLLCNAISSLVNQLTNVDLLTCREMLTISLPVEIRSVFSLRREFLTTMVSFVWVFFLQHVNYFSKKVKYLKNKRVLLGLQEPSSYRKSGR